MGRVRFSRPRLWWVLGLGTRWGRMAETSRAAARGLDGPGPVCCQSKQGLVSPKSRGGRARLRGPAVSAQLSRERPSRRSDTAQGRSQGRRGLRVAAAGGSQWSGVR